MSISNTEKTVVGLFFGGGARPVWVDIDVSQPEYHADQSKIDSY